MTTPQQTCGRMPGCIRNDTPLIRAHVAYDKGKQGHRTRARYASSAGRVQDIKRVTAIMWCPPHARPYAAAHRIMPDHIGCLGPTAGEKVQSARAAPRE